jgi:hypothetical protein
MVERRRGAGFGFESTAAGLVTDQPLRNDFERNRATQPPVEAAIDLAHASGAEEVFDLVGPESSAGWKRHGGPL